MRIFIPTLNRGPERQWTLRELGAKIAKKYRATIICPVEEIQMFRKAGMLAMPCRAIGISATRQWILEHSDDPHVLMLDDDLASWSWRTENDMPWKHKLPPVQYKKATDKEREAGFAQVAKLLNSYAHGSIGHRLFSNARDGLAFNTRQLRALAYNRDVLRAEKIKFRLPVMEDFDVQLQMLKRGHTCFQYNWLVQEQRGSNEDGGCSTYRTDGVQSLAAKELGRLHPDCVTVVRKEQKGNGTMWGTRTDVKVNWRRAIRAGMEHKNAHTK